MDIEEMIKDSYKTAQTWRRFWIAELSLGVVNAAWAIYYFQYLFVHGKRALLSLIGFISLGASIAVFRAALRSRRSGRNWESHARCLENLKADLAENTKAPVLRQMAAIEQVMASLAALKR